MPTSGCCARDGHTLVSWCFDLTNRATSLTRCRRMVCGFAPSTKCPSTASWTIARGSRRPSPRVTMLSVRHTAEVLASATMNFTSSTRRKAASSLGAFVLKVQFCFEAKRVARAESSPAAVFTFISGPIFITVIPIDILWKASGI